MAYLPTPSESPDFWDQLQPAAAAAPPTAPDPNFSSQVNALYQQAYGRDATPDEIASHQGNPNGIAGVRQMLGIATPQGQFGAVPAPFAPGGGTDFTPQALQMNYSPERFTEVAPTFTAPTGVTMQNDPGYQFRLQQAQQAVERSAAAKGTVLNPGTVAAEAQRVGDQASAEFGNVYARAGDTFDKALQTYGAKYNVFSGNADRAFQAAQFNAGNTNVNNSTGAGAAQQRFTNQATTYGINYGVNDKAQSDYWQRLMDQARLGAQTAAA